jgi:hypothetical protein
MRRILTSLALVLLAAMPAKAGLIGTQVSGTLVNPFGDDLFAVAGIPQPATIADPGLEFSTGNTFLSRIEVDFGADRLTLRLVTLQESFLYFPYTATFTFLTPGLVIGVDVERGGTIPLASGPTLSGDVLTFGTQAVSAQEDDVLSVTLALRVGEGTPVPVPGTLVLLGAAMLGLGVARRMRAS